MSRATSSSSDDGQVAFLCVFRAFHDRSDVFDYVIMGDFGFFYVDRLELGLDLIVVFMELPWDFLLHRLDVRHFQVSPVHHIDLKNFYNNFSSCLECQIYHARNPPEYYRVVVCLLAWTS